MIIHLVVCIYLSLKNRYLANPKFISAFYHNKPMKSYEIIIFIIRFCLISVISKKQGSIISKSSGRSRRMNAAADLIGVKSLYYIPCLRAKRFKCIIVWVVMDYCGLPV